MKPRMGLLLLIACVTCASAQRHNTFITGRNDQFDTNAPRVLPSIDWKALYWICADNEPDTVCRGANLPVRTRKAPTIALPEPLVVNDGGGTNRRCYKGDHRCEVWGSGGTKSDLDDPYTLKAFAPYAPPGEALLYAPTRSTLVIMQGGMAIVACDAHGKHCQFQNGATLDDLVHLYFGDIEIAPILNDDVSLRH